MSAWTEYLQIMAAERAFEILAGCQPTDEDLNELEQQHQRAWQQQMEDEEHASKNSQ